jgi:hypothetical protein
MTGLPRSRAEAGHGLLWSGLAVSAANCLRFALAWHTRLLTSLRVEEPGRQPDRGPTSARGKEPRARGQRTGRTRPGSPRPRQAGGRTAARAQNSAAA